MAGRGCTIIVRISNPAYIARSYEHLTSNKLAAGNGEEIRKEDREEREAISLAEAKANPAAHRDAPTPAERARMQADGNYEEMSLPVALHSPLSVFKERLAECSDIRIEDQVLILLDLTDPDRNHDRVLNTDYNNISLRDLHFDNNTVLSLHALGSSAEKRSRLLRDEAIAIEKKKIRFI